MPVHKELRLVPQLHQSTLADSLCTQNHVIPHIVVNGIEVGQGERDDDDFTVTVMGENDYNNFQKDAKYEYYKGGVSSRAVGYGAAKCFQYTEPTRVSASTLYTVITCTNVFGTCHQRIKLDMTCINAKKSQKRSRGNGLTCKLSPFSLQHSMDTSRLGRLRHHVRNRTPTESSTDSYLDCAGVNCNNSVCSFGVCLCTFGYSGSRCELNDRCSGVYCWNGNCADGICSCFSAYWGPSCLDSCSTVVCWNGVACFSLVRLMITMFRTCDRDV